MDTIFAQATAAGKAGVAVIRVSGRRASDTLKSLGVDRLSPRKASLRELRIDGDRIDRALVISFPKGDSFTGESVAELHLHGSPAIVRRILEHLGTLPETRLADPGEFTRRAMENGRLDLAQVEGLAALIDAETEAQRRQAERVFAGNLGQIAERWRELLIRAAALLEATIDFADEDVPVDVGPEVREILQSVLKDLRQEITGTYYAERIRDGFEVAIVGAPNAGKSTLLNSLAGRPAALTSEIAGTTRDVIEVRMDLRGIPVTILDTAGLREAEDAIERLGVERTKERARQADLRVFLRSADEIQDIVEFRDDDINIWSKSDLHHHSEMAVSGLTGAGIEDLLNLIVMRLETRAVPGTTATHARHRRNMSVAVGSLESALVEVEHGPDRVELAAEEIRSALRSLDSLVGRVDVENLLDEIFSRFCLGK